MENDGICFLCSVIWVGEEMIDLKTVQRHHE